MAASKSHTSSGSLESNWRLSNIDEWSPTSKTRNWLLISGASDPPERFIISDRRRRDESGEFLRGVTLDLHHMERAVKDDLHNSVKNLQITKSEVIGHIQEFFESCKEFYMKPMIFYTGHGERNTGNWCFSDGKLSFEDILNLIPAGMENPTIISDACFSGRWAIACDEHQRESLYCLSACGPDETARDSGLFIS